MASLSLLFRVCAGLLCFGSTVFGRGLGVVPASQPFSFELHYTNTGSQPVPIAQATSSCSCITVLDFPREVAAGATVPILCVYQSDRPGLIVTQVELRSHEGTTGDPIALLPVEGVVTRPEWLVSMADLGSAKWSTARLLDIRDEPAYSRLHIRDALSVPRFTLPARNDLREQSIILYDEGIDPVGLLGELAALRSEGFSAVYALSEGLAGWLRAARPVQGLVPSRVPYSSLRPLEFAGVRFTAPWRTLVLGAAALPSLGDAVRFDTRAEASVYLQAEAEPAGARWLVLSDDLNDYEHLEVELPLSVRTSVYYLTGGGQAWATYVNVAEAASAGVGQFAQTQTRTVETRARLASPKTGGRGCSSCGK